MARVFVVMFVMLSVIVSPLGQAYAFDSALHQHDHDMDVQNHADIELDSKGNPHNGNGHAHFGQHHGGDFYRVSQAPLVMPTATSVTSIGFGDHALLSDFCPGPLLEPPSIA
jgi:hypothetical protein